MLYSRNGRDQRAADWRNGLAASVAVAALLCLTTISVAAAGSDERKDAAAVTALGRAPKVVLISLDGARPDLIDQYIEQRVLPRNRGLGLLRRVGTVATQNVTATPSLTAVSHIAIATGSTAVNNDIPSNSFHAVASTITTGISGFAAPIGGYDIHPLAPSLVPTSEPMWVRLRDAGKSVATATWPGGDGLDIKINNTIVQTAAPTRTTSFTVPFGSFGGLGTTGFTKTLTDFAANPSVESQLNAAGVYSYSPVLVTSAPFETFYCASTTAGTCSITASPTLNLTFQMMAAAIDTTDDGVVNYDQLAVFDQTTGIQPGPFNAPSTGPAYVKAGGPSKPFLFEGTENVIGTGYFVSFMAGDLSTVRFVRYSSYYIARTSPVPQVIADIDEINSSVGFWRPQPDFRIPQRAATGMSTWPEIELETIYVDQGDTFVPYQAAVGRRALELHPDADLVMIYIEEPDGSGHQFTLTDPRQATDPKDAASFGANQDQEKVARFESYIQKAYQDANEAVDSIIQMVGVNALGTPRSNIFVVSDHGMAPFHTAVNLKTLLANAGVNVATDVLAIRTSGPAAHIYVNLAGREKDGTVNETTYQSLVDQINTVLSNATDPNWAYNYTLPNGRLFGQVSARPFVCAAGVGYCTDAEIGQDSGDVFAVMNLGYNFDGIQNPGVARVGDPAFNTSTTVFSVPSFYGAHGYDPSLPIMSASFLAAGPKIKRGQTVEQVRNIDVAPTISWILGVPPSNRVDGEVLTEILR